MGLEAPVITSAVRTGDTTSSARAAMVRTPPHILVTTPESLYLLLTSERSRERLRARAHGDRRRDPRGDRHAARRAPGAVARAAGGAITERPPLRIGLSATQRPVEAVARFLVGTACTAGLRADGRGRDCAVIDRRAIAATSISRIELPGSPLEAVMAHEVWAEYYDRLAALIREHRTTLVFVNTRKMAERLARQLADRLGEDQVATHHGSLSKERRLDAEQRLKTWRGPRGRRDRVARARHRHRPRRSGLPDRIAAPDRHAAAACRPRRPHHSRHAEGPALSRNPRRPGRMRGAVDGGAAGRARSAGRRSTRRSTCWRNRSSPRRRAATGRKTTCIAMVRRAWPYRDLSRQDFDAVIRMLADGFTTRRGRRGRPDPPRRGASPRAWPSGRRA